MKLFKKERKCVSSGTIKKMINITKIFVVSILVLALCGCSAKMQLIEDNNGASTMTLLGGETPPFDLDPNDPTIQSFYPTCILTGKQSSSLFYFKLMNSETMQYLAYWCPQTGDEGEYAIVFRATDSRGATAEQTAHFTVLPALNEPPMVLVRNN